MLHNALGYAQGNHHTMANQEPFSFNGRGRAPEQTPHSNVHHDEQPLNDFDNTPLAEAPLAYDPRIHEGDLTTEQLPEDFQPSVKKKEGLSKSKKIGISLAAAAGVIGSIFAVTTGGGSENTEPDKKPVASGPANPGQTQETQSFNIDSVAMLESVGTAAEVQASFDQEVSDVINNRVDSEVDSDGSDLQFLSSNTEAANELSNFVKLNADVLTESRAKQEEKGGETPYIAVTSTVVSSSPTQTGGFDVVASLRYYGVDKDGQLMQNIYDNIDTYHIDFEQHTFDLPDGNTKTTFAISSLERE